jgi:hypothetical protein
MELRTVIVGLAPISTIGGGRDVRRTPVRATAVRAAGAGSASLCVVGGDVLEQLRQLGELRGQGILTDDEFAARKAGILAT